MKIQSDQLYAVRMTENVYFVVFRGGCRHYTSKFTYHMSTFSNNPIISTPGLPTWIKIAPKAQFGRRVSIGENAWKSLI